MIVSVALANKMELAVEVHLSLLTA